MAAATATLSAPMLRAQTRPRVVDVGGGAGGATAARYIAKDSEGPIDVVLIEPTRAYYTCFFSNLYLGGFRGMNSLAHDCGTIASAGVNVIHDWALGVDRRAKTVSLAGGTILACDHLVLPPGGRFCLVAPPNPYRCPPGPYERISMVAHLLVADRHRRRREGWRRL